MNRLHQLSIFGQSVRIDFPSRDLIESGALGRAIADDAVVGVTANPTIFEKALARGDAYVPIEVERELAHDTQAAIDQGELIHDAIAKPNLRVKIPATDAGVAAIGEMTARGHSIPVTLTVSLSRHRQVIEAGGDPGRIHSVASFFVSRVDTETDRRLDALARNDLKGRLGTANTKLAFQDHGRVAPTLESDLEEAQYLFSRLDAAGIDYENVIATLEREGSTDSSRPSTGWSAASPTSGASSESPPNQAFLESGNWFRSEVLL
jgi:transaldolase